MKNNEHKYKKYQQVHDIKIIYIQPQSLPTQI